MSTTFLHLGPREQLFAISPNYSGSTISVATTVEEQALRPALRCKTNGLQPRCRCRRGYANSGIAPVRAQRQGAASLFWLRGPPIKIGNQYFSTGCL